MKNDFEGTLISTVITKQKIYLMSDGKLTSASTGESKDDHSKVHSINDKVSILVAGRYIPSLPSFIIQESKSRQQESVEEIAEITQEGFKKAWENLKSSLDTSELKDIRLFAFVVGFDGNQPRLFYIDNMTNPPFEIKERPLFDKPRDFEIGAMAHGNGNYNDASQTLVKHLQNNHQLYNGVMKLQDMILDAFNRTKKKLASSSPQIGGQTFFDTISQ